MGNLLLYRWVKALLDAVMVGPDAVISLSAVSRMQPGVAEPKSDGRKIDDMSEPSDRIPIKMPQAVCKKQDRFWCAPC
jgi:hypothetical protein